MKRVSKNTKVMKEKGKEKVESKHDIRFYCVKCGDSISVRDTLTHDYLYFLTVTEDNKEDLETIKRLIELDGVDYYKEVVGCGVRKDYLTVCAKRYIDGLKDTQHNEAIEWVDKAWFDTTIQILKDNNLGEMPPISGVKALEAVLQLDDTPHTLHTPKKKAIDILKDVEEDITKGEKVEEDKKPIELKHKRKLIRKKK